MSNIIHPFRLSIIGLTLLSLVTVNTAVAQREEATKQDLQTKSLIGVPADVKSPAENTHSTLDPWPPANIDALKLPVAEAASCSLPDVVSQAGVRVEELVHNLDRFSATEVIQHQPVNRSGKLQRPEIQKFNYVYSMKEGSDGYMISEEDRDLGSSPNGFTDKVATLG